MPNYTTTITVNGLKYKTLKDILPSKKIPLKILFIAKTPALKSVEIGHYFQGQQGKFFWNQLHLYGIINFKPNTYEDENLIENNCGFTDIVKIPRNFGDEPTSEEYKTGLDRILKNIEYYEPKIIVFVYKKVLDNILRFGFNSTEKSVYGLNETLKNKFKSHVFVFPMSGTPCTKEQRILAMETLKSITKDAFRPTKQRNTSKFTTQNRSKRNIPKAANKKAETPLAKHTDESNLWLNVVIAIIILIIYANIHFSN